MISNKIYWLFLFISIGFEVIGTTIMKASQETWPALGLVIMWTMIALAYFTLSKAVLRLPIGVAFACWEGLGLTLIALVSVLFLDEEMNLLKFLAICMLLAGTYLVNKGTDEGEVAEPSEMILTPAQDNVCTNSAQKRGGM